MMIKIAALIILGVVFFAVFGWVLRRRSARRSGHIRQLKNNEWSSTVYGCAESRAEF